MSGCPLLCRTDLAGSAGGTEHIIPHNICDLHVCSCMLMMTLAAKLQSLPRLSQMIIALMAPGITIITRFSCAPVLLCTSYLPLARAHVEHYMRWPGLDC